MKSYPFLLSTCKRYCHSCVETQVTSNAYEDNPPWENQQRRANLRSRCIKAEPRSRGEENFSNAANAKASARRQSNISRWESTGVPRGGGLPLSTAYLGNYVCHVCPFARFISHHPSRIHLSRSHAAFPPIEVGLQRSCVPKRKCCLNNVALPCALPSIHHRGCTRRRFLTILSG